MNQHNHRDAFILLKFALTSFNPVVCEKLIVIGHFTMYTSMSLCLRICHCIDALGILHSLNICALEV